MESTKRQSRPAQVEFDRLLISRPNQMVGAATPTAASHLEVNVRSRPKLRIDQTPESVFSAMFLFESPKELRAGELIALVFDGGIAGPAFGQMTRRMAIAHGLYPVKRVENHGAAQQRCGERMRSRERVRRRREGMTGIPVQLFGPRHQDPCHAFTRWPVEKELSPLPGADRPPRIPERLLRLRWRRIQAAVSDISEGRARRGSEGQRLPNRKAEFSAVSVEEQDFDLLRGTS